MGLAPMKMKGLWDALNELALNEDRIKFPTNAEMEPSRPFR